MGNFSRGFVQFVVLIFMTIMLAMSTQAATFGNASVKGYYSFQVILWTANSNTPAYGMIGVMNFDGVGNVTGSYNSISGGNLSVGALGGTYAVNRNGIGAIDFTSGSTAQFAIILNSNSTNTTNLMEPELAQGFQLLLTNDASNEVVSGTAVFQSAKQVTYSVANLEGTFTYLGNTWTANVNLPEQGFVGIFTFDGKGNVAGTQVVVFGGMLLNTENPSGTYTVDADGFVRAYFPTCEGCTIILALNSVSAGQATGLQLLMGQSSTNGADILSGPMLKQSSPSPIRGPGP
jgi:hypothetical protein